MLCVCYDWRWVTGLACEYLWRAPQAQCPACGSYSSPGCLGYGRHPLAGQGYYFFRSGGFNQFPAFQSVCFFFFQVFVEIGESETLFFFFRFLLPACGLLLVEYMQKIHGHASKLMYTYDIRQTDRQTSVTQQGYEVFAAWYERGQ